MRTILVLLISITLFIGGCKKKEIKKVSGEKPVPICTSLTPCLAGKYIPDPGSSDTIYIELKRNLCPGSIYNEYVVRNYDTVINKKAVDPIPYQNFIIVSSKEESRSAFAAGDKLVVSLSYNSHDLPVISTTYDNRVARGFFKVQ